MGTRIGTVRSIHRYPVKSMAGEALSQTRVTALGGLLGDRLYALRDEQAREIRGAKKWPVLMQCSARFDSEPSEGGSVPSVTMQLPDGTNLRSDAAACAEILSRLIGRRVSLCPIEPASNKAHYRRAQPGIRVIGALSRSVAFRRVLSKLADVGPQGAELRQDFGREPDEPLPDLSVFPAEIIEYTSPLGTYFDAFPLHLVTTATLAHMAALRPETAWDARRFRPNLVIETDPSLSGAVELGWQGKQLRIGGVIAACTVSTPRCSMVTHAQPGVARDTGVLRSIVKDTGQCLGMYASIAQEGVMRVGDSVELE
jgi:uncharacterized protein YcbX